MENFIADAREAVGAFVAMREARERGREPELRVVVRMPFINAGPSFYDTPEGCMFTHRDKDVHNAVREAFKGMSYEDKRVLCFSPEPGRHLLRVQLWRDALEPILSPRMYHKAMRAILRQYVSIKLNHVAKMEVSNG